MQKTRFFYRELFATASWVFLLPCICGVIVRLSPASAQQQLPDPRIFDELPAASVSPLPSLNVPTSPLPPSSPNLPPARPDYDFQAPDSLLPSGRPLQAANLYRVDVYGDSPSLLLQVQQIEPEAFVRQGERVIQAGVFADESNAQLRVRELEAQGIPAQVTPMAAGVGAGSVNRGRFSIDYPERLSSENSTARRTAERSYFVVIPGRRKDLPDIAAQVIRLGVREDEVTQREAPRGPHVAIGPFNERTEADRWSNYLRSVGMDARVYFGN